MREVALLNLEAICDSIFSLIPKKSKKGQNDPHQGEGQHAYIRPIVKRVSETLEA